MLYPIHPYGWLGAMLLVLPGLLLGAFWLRHRSLVLCTAGHAGYNALAFALLAWLG